MNYFTNVRLYRLGADGKKIVAPAGTVVFDMPEDEAALAVEKGYVREATIGETAEALAKGQGPKQEPPKKARATKAAETEKKPEDTKKPEDLA